MPVQADQDLLAATRQYSQTGEQFITDTAAHAGIEHFEANCEIASERAAELTLGLLKQLATLY